MKRWHAILVLSLHCMASSGIYAAVKPVKMVIVHKNVPQLEFEDTSFEEQHMLDVFEVETPSPFWHLVHKLGGIMVMRYTQLKQALNKKIVQAKGWWCERSSN